MIRSFLSETGSEVLKARRAPEYVVPTLMLPVAFYGLFAVAMAPGADASRYLLATYGVFAVMGPAIFGFGIGVAQERESGWLAWREAVPASRLSFIAAKALVTVLFGMMALALVYAMAGFIGGVALSRAHWTAMFSIHLVSVVPFVLLGLSLGFALPSNAAVAVANLVFLLLAAFGGLWMPLSMMPDFFQTIALALPSFHLGQLALAASGQQDFDLQHALIPAIESSLLLLLANWLSRRTGT